LKSLYFAISALVAAILVFWLSFYDFHRLNKVQNRFSEVLHEKEHELDQKLEYVSDLADSVSDLRNIYCILKDKFDVNEYALAIYKNDSLVFWTDNRIPFKRNLKFMNSSEPVILLGNAWYEMRSSKVDDLYILGLIVLKNEYLYENPFLHNNFQEDFNVCDNHGISVLPEQNGNVIYDVNGNYLFTLINQDPIEGEFDSSVPIILFFLSVVFYLVFLFML